MYPNDPGYNSNYGGEAGYDNEGGYGSSFGSKNIRLGKRRCQLIFACFVLI